MYILRYSGHNIVIVFPLTILLLVPKYDIKTNFLEVPHRTPCHPGGSRTEEVWNLSDQSHKLLQYSIYKYETINVPVLVIR
jgi:hypothetical protein